MAISRLGTQELDQIWENGYAIVPSCLDAPTLCELSGLLDAGRAGVRNLLDLPAVRRLATSTAVRSLIEPGIGPDCFAVRGILFNKAAGANWKVAWHQDCVIAVARPKEIPGWGPGQLRPVFTTFDPVPTPCRVCWRFASTWTNVGRITALCG
jgi:hypothetical protein